MKKSIVTASILALGITSATAMDLEMVVGIEGSLASVDSSLNFNGTVESEEEYGKVYNIGDTKSSTSTGQSVGLKLGLILDKQHRITFNASNHYNLEILSDDVDMITYTLNYDYLFTGDNGVTPYIGIHAGMSDVEYVGYSDANTMYGAQGGVILDITNNLEWEMGVSYSILTSEPKTDITVGEVGKNWNNLNGQIALEMEDMTRAYTSLNYKF